MEGALFGWPTKHADRIERRSFRLAAFSVLHVASFSSQFSDDWNSLRTPRTPNLLVVVILLLLLSFIRHGLGSSILCRRLVTSELCTDIRNRRRTGTATAQCVTDVHPLCESRGLQLNSSKTELNWFRKRTPRTLRLFEIPICLCVSRLKSLQLSDCSARSRSTASSRTIGETAHQYSFQSNCFTIFAA